MKNSQHRILLALFYSAFASPLLDIPSSFSIDLQWPFSIVWILNTLYYLSKIFTVFFFMLFIISQLEMGGEVRRMKKIVLSIPLAILALLVLLNLWTGLLFTYEDRVWKSGPMRSYFYVFCLFYYCWAFIYVSLNKGALGRGFKNLIQIVAVINIFAEVLQYFMSGILIHSFANAISMLLFVLNIEYYGIVLDSVTGMAKKEIFEKMAKKLFYYNSKFEVLFIRIKDYDMISSAFGTEVVEGVIRNIEQFFIEIAEAGNAFQIASDTFVLITVNSDSFSTGVEDFFQDLKKSWNLNKLDYSFDFFVSVLRSSVDFNDWERLSGYLQYFKTMSRTREGIVPVEELQVSNKVYERKVEKAIERGMREATFKVYYQPICTAKEKKFITCEALLRLKDPELGIIPPEVFVPIAEQSGLILRVGNYVLENVCRFILTHNLKELGLEYIEINLSAVQCMQSDFLHIIDETMETYRVPPKYICFEITETASNSGSHNFTENLSALSKRGYRLALDDFGTGYGNIQRMVSNDFEIIKFDKNIIQHFTESEERVHVYKTLVHMIKSMNCKVVAEGVETKDQYEFVRDAETDYIQGYYFSKPLPEEDFEHFLRLRNGSAEAKVFTESDSASKSKSSKATSPSGKDFSEAENLEAEVSEISEVSELEELPPESEEKS